MLICSTQQQSQSKEPPHTLKQRKTGYLHLVGQNTTVILSDKPHGHFGKWKENVVGRKRISHQGRSPTNVSWAQACVTGTNMQSKHTYA